MPLLAASTIRDIVHVMSALYRAAMKEHPPVVLANPFAELDLPAIEPRPVEFYEPEEAAALYTAVEELRGPKWHTLTELGMDVGCGRVRSSACTVTVLTSSRGTLTVVDVMTRKGLRQWPKSKKSHRVVPVPSYVLEGMSAALAGRSPRLGSAALAADHAPHRSVVARAGWRAAVRRPGAARA